MKAKRAPAAGRRQKRSRESSEPVASAPEGSSRSFGEVRAVGESIEALRLSEDDAYLLHQGRHHRLYHKLGAHPAVRDGIPGFFFAVWAPNARAVSVVGDFNRWESAACPLSPVEGESGVWDGFVPGLSEGALYKFHIDSRHGGYSVDKADPFAFYAEVPPATASVTWRLDYEWRDGDWMAERGSIHGAGSPVSIYEMHFGSWRRNRGKWSGYIDLADAVADYVSELGFTHIELMPVMEHPFGGSWGYQVTGYFAPTSRYGTPQDFMQFVDRLHQRGIGVILDWVPSHFPKDEHGLGYFDGTYLYEHADPRKGYHPDWKSAIFNYQRKSVRSVLLSNALFWLDRFHVDGLRVDAVASMLYLDYSRDDGEWIANEYGTNENLEAVSFLREFNDTVHEAYPDVLTIAEESTSWPKVSGPTADGGLGFWSKWDMGWMHDTLEYLQEVPVHRRHHHDRLTFRIHYAFAERFTLALSHDEVVHGKGSLLGKMPGDDWQKFANLRLLFAYMWSQPGKKLLFMGGEIAQWKEWDHDSGLDWRLLAYAPHRGVQSLVRDLNRLYRREPALHERDFAADGFEWVDCSDKEQSVISYLRLPDSGDGSVLAVFNFTATPRYGYRVGVPTGGSWSELLNTDAEEYGGSGVGNLGSVEATSEPAHGRDFSVELTLPPLGCVFFKPEAESRRTQ